MRQPVLISLLVLLVTAQGTVLAFWVIRDWLARSAQRAARHLQSTDTHAGRLALVGEIAGSIAHEISQPLSAILTNADAADSLLGQPVRSSLDASLPPIHGDSVHLEQVLLNLMMNSLDVMASNTANGVAERILDVTTSRHDEFSAAITVTDTGPGIKFTVPLQTA